MLWDCGTVWAPAPSTQAGSGTPSAAASPRGGCRFSGVHTLATKQKRRRAAPKRGWALSDCPLEAPAKELWSLGWRDHATTLLRVYNDALLTNPTRLAAAQRGNSRVVVHGSEGTLEALYAVYVWARRIGIVPEAWVRWNGRRVKTADDAKARLARLFDPDGVELYRADEMTSVNEADAQDAALHARLGSAGFVVGRDMHPGAEEAKRNFRERGREILCVEAYDLTQGFHPASPHCETCPLNGRCKAETTLRLSKDRR